jgi:hypothetical protein|tara:strand:- start:62 stop:700 length:639 start_codon:yes stop_codon:yes gene_type:complete
MTLPSEKLITINDRGARTATTFGSVTSGGADMVFIKKLTASSSGDLSFLNGSDSVVFDGTYKEYVFICKNIHGATDGEPLTFQVDTGTNTNYNIAVTNTFFRARHNEADTIASLAYVATYDQGQGTSFIRCNGGGGTGNDENAAMILHIFDPANTTFVKHFMLRGSNYQDNNGNENLFSGGYFNTTTALTRVQFKMANGNIDAGTICLYGIL